MSIDCRKSTVILGDAKIPIKFPFFIFICIIDDSFIFSVSIIIISTIQFSLIFILRMPSEYYCPNCRSEDVIVYDKHIECPHCNLHFSIEDLESDIDDENILSKQELQGIADSFEELKDEENREKFFNWVVG